MSDYNSKIKNANELFNKSWELEKQAHRLTKEAVLNEVRLRIDNFILSNKFLEGNLKYKVIIDEYNHESFEIFYTIYYYIENIYKLPMQGWASDSHIRYYIYDNKSGERLYELPCISIQEVDTLAKFNSLKNNLILDDE